MSELELIDVELRRALIVVADTLDYGRAAEALEVPTVELRKQISELESRLCLHIFEPGSSYPELTQDGKVLVRLFRETISHKSDG